MGVCQIGSQYFSRLSVSASAGGVFGSSSVSDLNGSCLIHRRPIRFQMDSDPTSQIFIWQRSGLDLSSESILFGQLLGRLAPKPFQTGFESEPLGKASGNGVRPILLWFVWHTKGGPNHEPTGWKMVVLLRKTNSFSCIDRN